MMMIVFLKSTVRPCAVGDAPVVEHLEKHVKHVRVRLLDFVEEDHGIGLSADRLGQLAALIVADVARRRADQARDAVLLHVFGHVDPHQRGLGVEKRFGERFRQFGLADACRAEKQEAADRPARILDAAPRA
jgi:hypothetical protein